MGLFDFLIPSMRRRNKLNDVAKSAAPTALKSALPLICKTNPSNSKDVDCVLHFFTRFTEYASDNAELVDLSLAHVASSGQLNSKQQQALTAIYIAIVQTSHKRGLDNCAACFGLAGYRCKALNKIARETILAKTVESTCVNADVVATLRAELSSGSAKVLVAAIKKGSNCDVLTDAPKAQTALVLARLAIDVCSNTDWSYHHAASALLAMAKYDEAIKLLNRGLMALPGQSELTFLLALAYFKEGQYQATIATLAKVNLSPKFPAARLRIVAEAAHCFCDKDDPNILSMFHKETLENWVRTLTNPSNMDKFLGPVMSYIRGRILAVGGHLQKAITCFEEAVTQRPDPLYVYYAVHSLQLTGRWQSARQMLSNTAVDCPAVRCLRLRQVLRDSGSLVEQEALAKAGEADPTGLVKAKYAVLSGQTISQMTDSPAEGRDFAEERLRIELEAALAVRNLPKAKSLLQTHLAVTLPAAEKLFFRGVFARLLGETTQAIHLLKMAIESMPEAAGVLKCLADCQMADSDLTGAIETLKKVVEYEPGDLRSHMRLIFACCELGREDGLIRVQALRERNSLQGQTAYLAGRVLLRECFKLIAKTAGATKSTLHKKVASYGSRWDAIRKLVESTDRIFVAAGNCADAEWYHWLCGIITSPPEIWSSNAAKWLEFRPTTRLAVPVEAQWIEGILKILVQQFDTAMEGAETLVEIAISTNGANVWQDVVWAMWRTAHLSASPPQYIRFTKTLKRCIEGGGQVANQLKSLFVSMVCHSFDGSEKSEEVDLQLTKVGISDEECRLVKAIHHLVREETEFARQMAKEKVESNSPNTAWFGLIQGLCALQCGDLNGLSEARHTSERPETSSQWAVLEAAACSRLGHAKAMEHLCDLIQHCFLDQTHATTTLPLSGILSYLGCLQQEKEKVAVVLGKLGYDALLTDSEAPLAYLRAASLMGLGNRAMNIFEQNIVLIQQSKNDFQNLYYHATTQAIEENQYEEAYALLTKAVKRD